MYSYKINKLPKKTLEILLTVPKADIANESEKAFASLQAELTVEGFRKGKVPKEIAEKHITKEALYQELLKKLLSRVYEEIVKKEGLQPIVSPKIDLTKAKEGEDWEIKMTLAERPLIDLGQYKEAIKKIKADQKKGDIWVPGKDKQEKKDNNDAKQKLLNEILSVLLKEAKFELSDLVVEDELNNRLTQLVDDVRKIGLTMDAYLKSKHLTIDDLKKRYKQEIEDTYKLEFILMEVADKENIKVEKEDLDKLLTSITNPEEKKSAEQNSYYYASILRKQKTLDFLLGL